MGAVNVKVTSPEKTECVLMPPWCMDTDDPEWEKPSRKSHLVKELCTVSVGGTTACSASVIHPSSVPAHTCTAPSSADQRSVAAQAAEAVDGDVEGHEEGGRWLHQVLHPEPEDAVVRRGVVALDKHMNLVALLLVDDFQDAVELHRRLDLVVRR